MNKVEPKKEKSIDSNHWMCKIQKYVFDIDATRQYSGYCPFFWMTWIAVVLFPIVALIKLLTMPVVFSYDAVSTKMSSVKEHTYQKWRTTPLMPNHYQFRTLNKLDEIEYAYQVYDSILCTRLEGERILLWLTENPNWRETHLPEALKKIEVDDAAHLIHKEKVAARNIKFRKLSSVISLCGSAVFKIIIPCLILGLAFLLYFLTVKLISVITLAGVLILSMIVIGALSVVMVAYLITDFISIWRMHSRNSVEDYDKSPSWISNTWNFIVETIQVTYKQECPMIVWGKETGPIKKREL